MICLVCRQAEVVLALTSAPFERDEIRLKIDNIPAQICPQCGDAVVGEDVAVNLLRIAEELLQAGMTESTRDFQDL